MADKANRSPSPPAAGGEGRGEEGYSCSSFPSLGERESRQSRWRQSRAPRFIAARDPEFPLPAGEGQGEGERDATNQNGRTNFPR